MILFDLCKRKMILIIQIIIHVFDNREKGSLTLYCIMLKNGQTYFKNVAVFTPQDF